MNDNKRWQDIEKIFFSAVDLDEVDREDYLRQTCGNDDVLYSEVTSLLKQRDSPSMLKDPIFDLGMQVLNEEVGGDGRTGTTLGQFLIGKHIGRGGMADVYRAEDLESGQIVAVKIVSGSFAIDRERVSRFRREATAVSRISHTNVAQLYGFYTESGENFIAMEFVDGVNLRQAMANKIELREAIEIAIQITSALAAAHAAGVVHRDIKPENIIIRPDGVVKVLDFGLAKLVGPISERLESNAVESEAQYTPDMSTEIGMLVGTPAYMSPEQIRGGDVDGRTDIWSVGVLLYEMLSGKLPFTGPTKIDSIAAILLAEPKQLNLESRPKQEKVNAIVGTALSKDKGARYNSSEELLVDLVQLRTLCVPKTMTTTPKSRAVWIALSVVVAAILLAGLFFTARYTGFFSDLRRSAAADVPLPVTDGLVSYWPADGNTDDLVGKNPGELLNGATYRPGVSGQAFSFDGIDDVFQASSTGLATGSSPRTVVAWVKVDDFVAEETPLAAYGTPRNTQAFALGTGDHHPFASNWGASVSAEKIQAGDWHQVAASVAAEEGGTNPISLYVDGECHGTSALRLNTQPDTNFYSGRFPVGRDDENRRLKGAVDEITVYNRALSAEEIATLFAAFRRVEK